jgi:hypothetical protein
VAVTCQQPQSPAPSQQDDPSSGLQPIPWTPARQQLVGAGWEGCVVIVVSLPVVSGGSMHASTIEDANGAKWTQGSR